MREPAFAGHRIGGRILLVGGLLWALSAAPLAAQQAEPYRIGEGDLLGISVFNEESLSGTFRVGADGAIGYPLLGHLDVAGDTVRDVERVLADRVSQIVPVGAPPTVVIEEYAPVFVVGDIDRSGPYEYRPGMIALELIALGGGMRRAAAGESGITNLIAAEQRLNELRLNRLSLLAQRTRLRAEFEGGSPDFDALPEGLAAPDARKRIVEHQTSLFDVRQKILDGQRRALAAQRTSFDSEIASLEEMIALHEDELLWMDQEVKTQQDLFDRGLTVQSRLLELKREASSDRRDLLQAQSYLARARQQQLAIDQRLQELDDTRAREVVETLSEVDTELVRVENDISAAWQTIAELRRQLNDPALSQPSPPQLTIVRSQGGERVTLPADQFSQLQPRDILRIEVIRPDAVTPAAPLPSSTSG